MNDLAPNIKFTRTQYMGKECTHDEYYSQFYTDSRRNIILNRIGEDAIANSKDPHFNDISLAKWDVLPSLATDIEMKKAGDYLTRSGNVCIAKAIARIVKASITH